jgi:hypothetical protein
MPVGRVRTLGDLMEEGHERVYMSCNKCSRTGSYHLASIVRHGVDKGLSDLLVELSRDCPQRTPHGFELCGATFTLPG